MADKTALVTAASRGIGRGIATRLAQDGYTVVNLDREAPAALVLRGWHDDSGDGLLVILVEP